MHGLYIERRVVPKVTDLSQDLAHHLFARQMHGRVVVVTPRPSGFMGAVKKQWSRVIRQAQNERSRTLDPDRIQELAHEIQHMQQLSITAKPPEHGLRADMTFAKLEVLLRVPAPCDTLYVTCPVERKELHMLTAWMPEHGLVVLYEVSG